METQTGMSSVEALPQECKYLAASKTTRGTSMKATATGPAKRQRRDNTCSHGIHLPVFELQTTVVKEGGMKRKTTTETVHCLQCYRQRDEGSSEDEDSDWGF